MSGEIGIRDIFKAAQQVEAVGGAFYRRYAQETDDPQIKKIFNSLAVMEQTHYDKFQAMAEAAQSDEAGQGISKENRSFISKTINQVIFGPDRKPDKLLKKAGTKRAALQTALDLENMSIDYYTMIKQEVSPEAARQVEEIIREEEQHAQSITNLMENLTSEN